MQRNAIAPDLQELLDMGSPGDIDFYSQYARLSNGPVLVLLCGIGKVAIPIARQGIPVIGLDPDIATVDHAKRKAQQMSVARVMFIRGDPANFVSDSKHPLVIIPDGGLQQLLTLEEQRGCLTAVRNAMQVGGRLVFDVPLLEPGAVEVDTPVVRRCGQAGEKMAVLRSHRSYDGARQIAEELITCDWLDEQGQVERRQYASRSSRFATAGEYQLMLELCGFTAECYGGFDRQPLLPGATRLVVEAERNR